ncbi:hypothetical protein Lal_00017802 [Lupinus albus]|nr:hypothetical protein Lal_00017802 [Lupinus albus]
MIQSGSKPKKVVFTMRDQSYCWILDVGDGKLSKPNDGYASIEIPYQFLISNIHAIVTSTYPNILHEYLNEDFLHCSAILASTIEMVDEINDYRKYLSSDSVDKSEFNDNEALEGLTPEFLNSLRTSGLPNHKIKLKIGTPIMLLRNLDQGEGLCNGTKMIVSRLANHVIKAKIMTGKNVGKLYYIPRMSMSLSQRQFPLIVSYVMIINKSQGQSLANIGLYLPHPVFSHGQLYVAFSRVQSMEGLKVLILDKEGKPSNTTTNVVFKQVF